MTDEWLDDLQELELSGTDVESGADGDKSTEPNTGMMCVLLSLTTHKLFKLIYQLVTLIYD